ncbi:MAG: STAS domain-containing protein [Myxococcota bacterium]
MLIQHEDFTIDCSAAERAVVAGVLRLPSPSAYEERLAPLREGLLNADSTYTIDLSQVQFLNSSGITGISRLVLLARSEGKRLVLIGSRDAVWQGKTLRLIARLYDKLEVELV